MTGRLQGSYPSLKLKLDPRSAALQTYDTLCAGSDSDSEAEEDDAPSSPPADQPRASAASEVHDEIISVNDSDDESSDEDGSQATAKDRKAVEAIGTDGAPSSGGGARSRRRSRAAADPPAHKEQVAAPSNITTSRLPVPGFIVCGCANCYDTCRNCRS